MDDNMLDLSGLKCPLPALMARKALSRAAPGTVLTIIATDPLAEVDIPHMCAEEGHAVEEITRQPHRTLFAVRRGTNR